MTLAFDAVIDVTLDVSALVTLLVVVGLTLFDGRDRRRSRRGPKQPR